VLPCVGDDGSLALKPMRYPILSVIGCIDLINAQAGSANNRPRRRPAGSSRDYCRRKASCLWAVSPRWARACWWPIGAGAARCIQSGSYRGASRPQIDRPRRDRQRLSWFLRAACRRRLLPPADAPVGASVGDHRVTLPVSLRRSAGAPPVATGPTHVMLFRHWSGAFQGCRPAQEGESAPT
jgi:hypothetical protein